MKRIVLCVCLALALLLSACGQSASEPAAAETAIPELESAEAPFAAGPGAPVPAETPALESGPGETPTASGYIVPANEMPTGSISAIPGGQTPAPAASGSSVPVASGSAIPTASGSLPPTASDSAAPAVSGAAAPGHSDSGPTGSAPEDPFDAAESDASRAAEAYVKAALDLSGSYTDQSGNRYDYVYQIPEITLDSAGARALNAQLLEALEKGIEQERSNMEQKLSLGLVRVEYRAFLNGSVLSVVVRQSYDWESVDYLAVNLDVTTGEALDRAALLERAGLDEDSFLSLAARAVESYFMRNNSYAPSEFESLGLAELLEKSSAAENFGPELPLLLQQNGRLCMAARIYSLAGAEYYEHLIIVR